MTTEKIRLDQMLVKKGITDTRSKAQSMIQSGVVYVGGKKIIKSSFLTEDSADICIIGEVCPYVSRGGYKIEKALRHFNVNPSGYICCDAGASTGGFTDCLLQNGAAKVYAIDVGTNQLVEKLHNDPRVISMEQCNIRDMQPGDLQDSLDLAVIDVSFISLRLVLPAVYRLLKEDGQVLCLIKPQFEAGKGKVGKKGVVKSPDIHASVLRDFLSYSNGIGFCVCGITFSPIKGPEGNIEFLGHLKKGFQNSIPEIQKIVHDAHLSTKEEGL